MHEPIRKLFLVVVIAGPLAGASALAPSPAQAYHTYQARFLDSTAYSLQRRNFRLAIFDQLQVTTYTAPWLLGAIFEDVAPNIEFKSTFYDHNRLALSGSFAFITGTIDIEGAAVVDVLQLWAMAEWRLSRVVAFTFTVRWVP